MTVPDYSVAIKTYDDGDTSHNIGDVRMLGKKYNVFLRRETIFENNKNKLFSVIWDQCPQSMKD